MAKPTGYGPDRPTSQQGRRLGRNRQVPEKVTREEVLETDAKLARGVLTRGRRCMPARTRLGEAVPCDTSCSPVPSGAAHQARWRRQAPRIHAQQRARTCRRERRDLDVTAARRAACREATAMVAAFVARSPAHARKLSRSC